MFAEVACTGKVLTATETLPLLRSAFLPELAVALSVATVAGLNMLTDSRTEMLADQVANWPHFSVSPRLDHSVVGTAARESDAATAADTQMRVSQDLLWLSIRQCSA